MVLALEQRSACRTGGRARAARLRDERAACAQQIDANTLALASAQGRRPGATAARRRVADEAELDPLIERASVPASLRGTREAAMDAIHDAGDGLALAQLAAECDACELASLSGELEACGWKPTRRWKEQRRLGGLLADARAI